MVDEPPNCLFIALSSPGNRPSLSDTSGEGVALLPNEGAAKFIPPGAAKSKDPEPCMLPPNIPPPFCDGWANWGTESGRDPVTVRPVRPLGFALIFLAASCAAFAR